MSTLEPFGYAFAPLGDGVLQFDVTTDSELLSREGRVLGGLTLDAIQPGDSVLACVISDNVAGQQTRVEPPFTARAAA